MSTGKKKSTTTTVNNNEPPAWSVPYFQQSLDQASQAAKQPFQAYSGPTVAGFSGDQLDSFDMTRGLAQQNSVLQGVGSGYIQDTISGKNANPYLGQTNQYAGDNTHLQGLIDSANRDITRNYTDSTLPSQLSQFSAGGAYGGSAMQQALTAGQRTLADQLSDTTTQLRSEDYNRQAQLAESALNRNSSLYNQDQQLRQSALGFLPQLQQMGYTDVTMLGKQGALQQGLQQQAIDDDRAEFEQYRNWDANRAGLLTNALGAIRGGTSSNSSTGDNPNYKSAGENAAGYAAILASLYG